MKNNWPELKFADLQDTLTTVQLWAQIVGKIRLRKMPWLNHSWHVTLYVSPNGLTTGNIPYEAGSFRIDFDFIKHKLFVVCSTGHYEEIALRQRTVASFYTELFEKLAIMGIDVTIYPVPNELPVVIPFAQDDTHFVYDGHQVNLFWQALVKIDAVFNTFRARFTGKCSPVHLFWGAFDLAATRFSGRVAPKHPGGAPNMPLAVMQEAYSHEVSSCGFWGGSPEFPYPAFYAYCYPTPAQFGSQPVKPEQAFYNAEMGEFFLKYDDLMNSVDIENTLLNFMQTTYEAAANTGNWDRASLECDLTRFEKHR